MAPSMHQPSPSPAGAAAASAAPPATAGGNVRWVVCALLFFAATINYGSTIRWIRPMARARPVAGSMSTWTALNTTGPSPTANVSAGR